MLLCCKFAFDIGQIIGDSNRIKPNDICTQMGIKKKNSELFANMFNLFIY